MDNVNCEDGNENFGIRDDSYARVDRADGSFLGVEKKFDGAETYIEGSTMPWNGPDA